MVRSYREVVRPPQLIPAHTAARLLARPSLVPFGLELGQQAAVSLSFR